MSHRYGVQFLPGEYKGLGNLSSYNFSKEDTVQLRLPDFDSVPQRDRFVMATIIGFPSESTLRVELAGGKEATVLVSDVYRHFGKG